ncbi:inner nuclear membrane protein enriched at telomere/subtelomere region [Tilletia horrida]|nr:inner nuclear membrane protein enriched at telomere/subtelomere region [Tilletia horrida]
MVATRRGAKTGAGAAETADAARAAGPSSALATPTSTETARRRTIRASAAATAGPRMSTPVKIEFAGEEEGGSDDDDDDDARPRAASSRTAAGRRAPVSQKGKQKQEADDEHDEDAPQRRMQPRQQPRQSQAAAASSLNIAEIRQMMRDGGKRPSNSPVSTPPAVKPEPVAAPAPPKAKKATAAKSAAAGAKKPARKASAASKKQEATSVDLGALLQKIVGVALALTWLLYNKQTHLIGYCDSSAATAMASTLFDASPAVSTGPGVSALRSNSNAILRNLEQHDADLDSNTTTTPGGAHPPFLLSLFPPYLRPSCSPCPAHAICQDGVVLGCASREYAATTPALLAQIPVIKNILPHDGQLPIWLGGGTTSKSQPVSSVVAWVKPLNKLLSWIFTLAHGPRCVPDTHKLFLALQVGDEIRRVMRERRGKMECGQKGYPSDAASLDVKAWDARVRLARAQDGAAGGATRRWGRSSKAETALPLRNVPHWPEPYLVEANEDLSGGNTEHEGDAAPSGLFTTDSRAYASEDYLRFNATFGPGGYIRWDLLQQHYPDIRYAEAENAIKEDLLERIDVAELRCTASGAAADNHDRATPSGDDVVADDDIELDDPNRKERARACFEELWELAISDLQRAGGVLRFPVTGFAPAASKRRGHHPADGVSDPYEAALLLSTTSIRSLGCSIRLAAISAIVEILPWFLLSTALLAVLGYLHRRRREGKEEVVIAAQVREEVIAALRERARGNAHNGDGAAQRGGKLAQAGEDEEDEGVDADTTALLGDLSIGAEEDGQAYLPIAHLRDLLLPSAGSERAVARRRSSGGAAAAAGVDPREHLTPKRARRVWNMVRRQVGSNSNVRTNSRFWKGESMLVWEWVGV